jgi:hypothetical protein
MSIKRLQLALHGTRRLPLLHGSTGAVVLAGHELESLGRLRRSFRRGAAGTLIR